MTTRLDIPTVETDRLRLRAPKLEDEEVFAAFYRSDAAAPIGGPMGKADSFLRLASLYGHWALRGFGRWVVADKSTDQALGVVGLYNPPYWPEPEIAWTVFEQAQGKSYAYEAALASRTYAYGTLGWSSVISCIAEDNPRSIALALRMGAVPEGIFNHPDYGPLRIYRHQSSEDVA